MEKTCPLWRWQSWSCRRWRTTIAHWQFDDGERPPPGGPAEAGAAATNGLDDGERAPSGSSAEARAAAGRDDGERAPPGGLSEHDFPDTVLGHGTKVPLTVKVPNDTSPTCLVAALAARAAAPVRPPQ